MIEVENEEVARTSGEQDPKKVFIAWIGLFAMVLFVGGGLFAVLKTHAPVSADASGSHNSGAAGLQIADVHLGADPAGSAARQKFVLGERVLLTYKVQGCAPSSKRYVDLAEDIDVIGPSNNMASQGRNLVMYQGVVEKGAAVDGKACINIIEHQPPGTYHVALVLHDRSTNSSTRAETTFELAEPQAPDPTATRKIVNDTLQAVKASLAGDNFQPLWKSVAIRMQEQHAAADFGRAFSNLEGKKDRAAAIKAIEDDALVFTDTHLAPNGQFIATGRCEDKPALVFSFSFVTEGASWRPTALSMALQPDR